jgi:hypothetical protein
MEFCWDDMMAFLTAVNLVEMRGAMSVGCCVAAEAAESADWTV